MFRLLRFLARNLAALPRIADGVQRIAATLESTVAPKPVEREIVMLVHDPDEEAARRDAYERHSGHELGPYEEVPEHFNPEDPAGALAAYLTGKKPRSH